MKRLKLWHLALIAIGFTIISILVKSPFQYLDMFEWYGLPWGWHGISITGSPLPQWDWGMFSLDCVIWFFVAFIINKYALKK